MNNYALIFNALSDPIRLAILKRLYSHNCVCVCEFIDMFDLSQSKLSYHLKSLLNAGLICKESRGKWNFYAVNKDVVSKILTQEVINELFIQE